MSDFNLEKLARMQAFLDNRQPLVAEFKTLVGSTHKEVWPDFVVIGLAKDFSHGVLKPAVKGVPPGRVKYKIGEGPDWWKIVELSARITASRSRRWDPVSQTVLPIPEAWSTLAYKAFPFLCSMEVGSGWADLMIATAGWISESSPPAGWKFSQIKEKFGGLRLYDGTTEAIDDICNAAETLSEHICDRCGAPGRLRNKDGWYSTRCDQHV